VSVTATPETQIVDGCARGFVELEGGEEIVSEVSNFFAGLLAPAVVGRAAVQLSVAFEVRQRPIEQPLPAVSTTVRALPSGSQPEPLTPAEERVLRYLPTNLNCAAIGRRLCISRSTVKSHARMIYQKFGVHSRAEAVVAAQQYGLVPDYSIS
jgi:DNA-binding CsgD family transcriptional regulator